MDRMKKLINVFRMLIHDEFSGYIKINFTQGSIGRIEKAEEFDDTATVHMAEGNSGKKADRGTLQGYQIVLIPLIIPLIIRLIGANI
ncbi:MAG: hypothetical protein M0Z61_14380 [Nitrospiraceae bacterium]|nr:hypothetical protein [Nitrospiraceae bacterium]